MTHFKNWLGRIGLLTSNNPTLNTTKYGNYYECHITIEPVFDNDLKDAKAIAKIHGFKVAELYMQKSREDTEERSSKDTFMTSHSVNIRDVISRMYHCKSHLELVGFKVWRCKIEDIVMDEKYNRG